MAMARAPDSIGALPQGLEYEARTDNRSRDRAAFAQPAPGNQCRFILEGRPAVAVRRDPKLHYQGNVPAQPSSAHERENNPELAQRLFRCGTTQKSCGRQTAQKIRQHQRSLLKSKTLDQINSLSPLSGAAKLPALRRSLFLERPETHLYDYNHANSRARRSDDRGDEIGPATVPTIPDCSSPARVTREGTLSADGF